MNENIDLTKILKDCPIGWEFYSSIYGDVTFRGIENNSGLPIKFFFFSKYKVQRCGCVTEKGLDSTLYNGECTFFPSKGQRDWSKFSAPWYKKEKFDPKTLNPFDKVIVKPDNGDWHCSILSHRDKHSFYYRMIDGYGYPNIVPYNEETKRLLGTNEEAPEYYRYWED